MEEVAAGGRSGGACGAREGLQEPRKVAGEPESGREAARTEVKWMGGGDAVAKPGSSLWSSCRCRCRMPLGNDRRPRS